MPTIKIQTYATAASAADAILKNLQNNALLNSEKDASCKPCGVFDVDETLLFNRNRDTVEVNEDVFRVYDSLRRAGAHNFVVTARRVTDASLQYVIDQLKSVGYNDDPGDDAFQGVYMVNAQHDDDRSASGFKERCRRRVLEKGYKEIAVNAGDNWSDLTLHPKDFQKRYGGAEGFERSKSYVITGLPHARLSWKLPNQDYEVD